MLALGNWPLVIPDSKTTFAKLDAADLSPEGCVIWLDDIDHLIGADGIFSGALQRLAQAGNVIIGTIRSAEYDRIQPTDQLRPPEWDVISGFEWIFISRELSQGEEDRLDAVVADPGIRARIRNIGIGEYVGAINSGHDEFAARAAYGLGDLLAEQGDA